MRGTINVMTSSLPSANPDQSRVCSIQTRQLRDPSGNSTSSIGLWPDCSSASITERRQFERLNALRSTARIAFDERFFTENHRVRSWWWLLWIISAITARKAQITRSKLRWLISEERTDPTSENATRDLDQRWWRRDSLQKRTVERCWQQIWFIVDRDKLEKGKCCVTAKKVFVHFFLLTEMNFDW